VWLQGITSVWQWCMGVLVHMCSVCKWYVCGMDLTFWNCHVNLAIELHAIELMIYKFGGYFAIVYSQIMYAYMCVCRRSKVNCIIDVPFP
jgi:hypothetical protein